MHTQMRIIGGGEHAPKIGDHHNFHHDGLFHGFAAVSGCLSAEESNIDTWEAL